MSNSRHYELAVTGWFEELLPVLANELVFSESLSPTVGWSLSTFIEDGMLVNFVLTCIEREPSLEGRKYILGKAVCDLSLNDTPKEVWKRLKEIAQKNSIENIELNDILNSDTGMETKNNAELHQTIDPISHFKQEAIDIAEIMVDFDLTLNSGISQAIKRFDAIKPPFRNVEAFWQEVISRIDETNAVKFLRELIIAEAADLYDIKNAISYIPKEWKLKVSVRREWPQLVQGIAQRFAVELSNYYTLRNFLTTIPSENDLTSFVQKGILEGLSSNKNLADASTFFGFIRVSAPLLSPEQAMNLLNFSLARFELHMEADFGDGEWSSWLLPPEDKNEAFAGFIWAALGSPNRKIRWKAAHSIRKLAEANCDQQIDFLITWMKSDVVGAFGSNKFPFYNLHARLYLLIAFTRVSLDHPQILNRHRDTFLQLAIEGMPHILIQKFSAEIALNLEKSSPGTYRSEEIRQLQMVGISQLPTRELKDYSETIELDEHLRKNIGIDVEYYHGYDFDHYWFEPLGRVFGITSKQVVELATDVVINQWRIETDGSFTQDPRSKLWNSPRNQQKTYHSHSSYPEIDTYSFYLSYHAMFVVAAKLLEKMPVVRRSDWYENEWSERLQRHWLTRVDGRWLADRRDPIPFIQRDWINERATKTWLTDLTMADFLDGLLFERDGVPVQHPKS